MLSQKDKQTSPLHDELDGMEDIASNLVPKGWRAYDHGDYVTSRALAERCLRGEKRPVYALSLLGASLLRLGDQASARRCIEEISSRFPNFLIGKLLRAECALLDGQYRQAETDALQVLKANPDAETTIDYALSVLAQAWGLEGPAEAHLTVLTDFAGPFAKNPTFLAHLARAQFKLGRRNEASQNLRKALDLAPDHELAAALRVEWNMTPDPRLRGTVSLGESSQSVETTPAGRLHRPVVPRRPPALREVSLTDLSSELLARIKEGSFGANEEAILLGCEIQEALRHGLEVHNNRWSKRRYRDLFGDFYGSLGPLRPPLEGATIVELGCGCLNPYGLLFLFLMLGARRGIGIDLDEIQDVPRAVRAVADLTAMMLIDPGAIVGDYPITRELPLQNIASFDLSRLYAGDLEGVDSGRLTHRRESVNALSLADGEADFVISNSFFEHITSVDEAIAEMARITRTGGIGVHNIDGADHKRYEDPACHPLEFLTEAVNKPLVNGSNRIRPLEFLPLFKRHGFDVISFVPFETVEITAELRNRFVEPFRSMTNRILSVFTAKIVVRRL